jgi:hypothetical protein
MAYSATNAFVGFIEYLKIDTVDVGGVGAEVNVNFDLETEDLFFGQSRTKIGTLEKTKKYQIGFEFGEFILENMAIALGQPATNLTGTTYLLITSAAADTVAIEAKVKNEQKDVYYTFDLPSCKLADTGGIGFSRESQGFMPVTFDILVVTGVNIGSIQMDAV